MTRARHKVRVRQSRVSRRWCVRFVRRDGLLAFRYYDTYEQALARAIEVTDQRRATEFPMAA